MHAQAPGGTCPSAPQLATPICHIAEILCKNYFKTQNFAEIRQSVADLWAENDYQYGGRPPSCILGVQ